MSQSFALSYFEDLRDEVARDRIKVTLVHHGRHRDGEGGAFKGIPFARSAPSVVVSRKVHSLGFRGTKYFFFCRLLMCSILPSPAARTVQALGGTRRNRHRREAPEGTRQREALHLLLRLGRRPSKTLTSPLAEF